MNLIKIFPQGFLIRLGCSQKSLLNRVPCVPYVPACPACLACPTCLRALRVCVPSCLACPMCVPIYKLRTGIRKMLIILFAFAYFPSVLIFYKVNRQCQMSCTNLEFLLRMRRISYAIISCFNPLYVLGLIFYKVNRQCRMSCTNLEILLRMRRISYAIISCFNPLYGLKHEIMA